MFTRLPKNMFEFIASIFMGFNSIALLTFIVRDTIKDQIDIEKYAFFSTYMFGMLVLEAYLIHNKYLSISPSSVFSSNSHNMSKILFFVAIASFFVLHVFHWEEYYNLNPTMEIISIILVYLIAVSLTAIRFVNLKKAV